METVLGKYQAYRSPLHRMDARIKFVGMILFMVSIFLSYGSPYMNLTIYAVVLVMLILLSWISHSSFLSVFRSLAGLWVMILFILILNLFFNNNVTGDIAFRIGNLDVYWYTIINILYIFSRLVLVLAISNVFTSTTKPMEMTNAIEWLFYPLSLIKIPVHKFAMAISLALRFIPTLQEEADRIQKAQASRGVDFKQGKFKEKVKSIVSLIIPLFMSAFTTSGQLADAMEARGYDPDSKRTKYKTEKFGLVDVVGILFLAGFLFGMIYLPIKQYDIYEYFHVELPKLK